jgi:hypothetical protein
MKTNWEVVNDGVRQQIDIGADYITLSEGAGFTEIGRDWTHAEFLAGKQLQHAIAIQHGPAVLAEVMAAVEAARSYPPFVEKLAQARDHLARFHAIPLDHSLPELLAVSASSVYQNGGNGETIVRSDSVTLTLEGLAGSIRPNDSEEPGRAFRLGNWGNPSGVSAWKDLFCVMLGNNFVLVDAGGGVEPFPVDNQIKLGQELRLNDCFRHPDAWIFRYWWLGVSLPRGLFRYEHGKGFTGRWEEP